MKLKTQTGWNAFRILWAGQSLSLLGTGMTRFALLVWAYQQAGTVTALTLLGFFASISYVAASPFAGVLVDRWNRRRVMFFADLGAGMMTVLLLCLNFTGHLEVWHLYLAEGIAGICEAFQEPAFSAAITLLVPREDYTRSSGMIGLGKSISRLLSPALAGLLFEGVGLNAVMMVDLFTLFLALSILRIVSIPAAPQSSTGQQAMGNFWHELRFGFKYILQHRGLNQLMIIFFFVNLFGTISYIAIYSPMVLSRTGGDEVALGTIRTIMGLGGIVGGLLITTWRAPWKKAKTYLVSTALSFLFCDFLTAVSRTTLGWSIAGFLSEATIPFISSPYYALWQENVPADVQGRVFSTREMVQVTSMPIGYLAGGLLADHLFEPALMPGGALAGTVGWLVGTGPGAGMASMFLCTSILGCLTGAAGLFSSSIRRLENKPEG